MHLFIFRGSEKLLEKNKRKAERLVEEVQVIKVWEGGVYKLAVGWTSFQITYELGHANNFSVELTQTYNVDICDFKFTGFEARPYCKVCYWSHSIVCWSLQRGMNSVLITGYK